MWMYCVSVIFDMVVDLIMEEGGPLTLVNSSMAIEKASALSYEVVAKSDMATAGSTSVDSADDVATASSTMTRMVTVVLATSFETLSLPTNFA